MQGRRFCSAISCARRCFLHRHRVVGAALDRGVVGDDHTSRPVDPADAGDDPGARRLVRRTCRGRRAARARGTASRGRAGASTRSRGSSLPRRDVAARAPSRRRRRGPAPSCARRSATAPREPRRWPRTRRSTGRRGCAGRGSRGRLQLDQRLALVDLVADRRPGPRPTVPSRGRGRTSAPSSSTRSRPGPGPRPRSSPGAHPQLEHGARHRRLERALAGRRSALDDRLDEADGEGVGAGGEPALVPRGGEVPDPCATLLGDRDASVAELPGDDRDAFGRRVVTVPGRPRSPRLLRARRPPRPAPDRRRAGPVPAPAGRGR